MAATQTYLNPGPMPFLNIPRTFFEDRETTNEFLKSSSVDLERFCSFSIELHNK